MVLLHANGPGLGDGSERQVGKGHRDAERQLVRVAAEDADGKRRLAEIPGVGRHLDAVDELTFRVTVAFADLPLAPVTETRTVRVE